ncbi:N-acetyltransferase domain-containing protein [Mycena venus]|uniref:N-acetyltransferase domain-containing protein n=1 Tax=Mycena venus TaxID=2733690 RepID=A0A8H7CGK6_9AGAR|nr:N-acetyltransferase domain-containing protein [Mycena venus]
MSAFRVRKLDPSTVLDASDPGSIPERDAVYGMLTRAFTGDLFTAVVMGHDPEDPDTSYIGPLHMTMVVAGLLGGEVYVAETVETSKIVGCAVWFEPGRALFDSPEQQQHALHPLMASFDKELRDWWRDIFLPKYDAFVTSALGEGTKLASWHLQTLGVDPAYHRQGVGKLLVNVIAEKARATQPHAALCVECATETNIGVYTKLGFHLMPKDNKGPDTCKATHTGIKGHSTPHWALLME